MRRKPSTKHNNKILAYTFKEKGWATLLVKILACLGSIIGEGSSSKTETLLKSAHLVTIVYGFDIIYVDAKGDDD